MTGPGHSLARRLAFGTFSNAGSQTVVLVLGLVMVPVIVKGVGAADYGLWVLISAVANFGFLLDIGISAALIKYVAEHAARDERPEAARMVAAATWVYVMCGIAITALGVAVAFAIPALVGTDEGESGKVVALIVLAAAGVGISLPAVSPLGVLRGLQRFGAVNVLVAAGGVLGAALQVGALLLDTGIVGVSAATLISSLLAYAASLVVARALAPDIMRPMLRYDRGRIRRLLGFSAPVAVIQVAGRLKMRLDAIVIGAALPVRFVTPYDLGRRLADGTRIATEQFLKVLLPVATDLGTRQDVTAIRTLLVSSIRLSLAIALAVALPLAWLGGDTLALWVGDEYRSYGGVVAILVVSAVVELAAYPSGAVLQSLERHKPLAWMAIVGAVINVVLSIAFVGPFGVTGVATATLIATAAEVVFLVFPYTLKTLEVPLRKVLAEVLLRLVVPVAGYMGLLALLSTWIEPTSIVRLAVVVGIAVLGYTALYAVVAAGPYERSAYRAAAGAVVKSLRRSPAPSTRR